MKGIGGGGSLIGELKGILYIAKKYIPLNNCILVKKNEIEQSEDPLNDLGDNFLGGIHIFQVGST